MNWEAIGAIGELMGATAVVVTLLYLVKQIKQNTESTDAVGLQTWQSTARRTGWRWPRIEILDRVL